MYRFKIGKLAGMTMEHAMLRYASDLYQVAGWAEEKDAPRLVPLVTEFRRLRRKLRRARIVVDCAKSGCKRKPDSMTLPLGYDHYYWPQPDFWCKKHKPSLKWDDEDKIVSLPISFDTIDDFEERKNRVAVHRSVLKALGIRSRRSISETFARKFFANIGD